MASQLTVDVVEEIRRTGNVLACMLEDSSLIGRIRVVAELCTAKLRSGGKILFAGNGASAGDAQHLASDLVSRYAFDRPGLAALSLSTNSSVLTAVGNDYGYEHVFSRQIHALGRAGDVFIGISTSGRSPNILLGLQTARALGLSTVLMTGAKAAAVTAAADHVIAVPSEETPRVQEGHIVIGHVLCAYIERQLFGL